MDNCCRYCNLKKGGECKYLLSDLEKCETEEDEEQAYLYHEGVRIPDCENKYYDWLLAQGECRDDR